MLFLIVLPYEIVAAMNKRNASTTIIRLLTS